MLHWSKGSLQRSLVQVRQCSAGLPLGFCTNVRASRPWARHISRSRHKGRCKMTLITGPSPAQGCGHLCLGSSNTVVYRHHSCPVRSGCRYPLHTHESHCYQDVDVTYRWLGHSCGDMLGVILRGASQHADSRDSSCALPLPSSRVGEL